MPRTSHALLTSSYSYVNQSTVFANNLSFISWDGKIVMKGDDTTTLQAGEYSQRQGPTS
jgi:hypothetical protein